jgi:uncharacterized protein with HEPN domain
MSRDPRSYLEDVVGASHAILGFVEGVDENRYVRDDMLHSAVERKFEIVGEALSQLSKLHPEITERVERLREIIAFRNLLIHGYAAVRHDRVLDIARRSLPTLLASVERLLEELSQGD